MNVPLIDIVPVRPIDLPFCGNEIIEGIKRVTGRTKTLYIFANTLEERGGLGELASFVPKKAHR
jgi:hypothetical protein